MNSFVNKLRVVKNCCCYSRGKIICYCFSQSFIYTIQCIDELFISICFWIFYINIVLINWANYKLRQAYGESFGNFILADLNFAAQNLFHEILHSVLPSHIKENSKGKYFIGESVITWLELFLSGEKGKELAQIAEIKGNLYDTEINHAETWDCIYTKGPAIIEHIAQEYGRKRMAESLIAFLLETQGEEIDYDCFYTYMKTKMSVTLLNKFDELIRH